MYHGIVPIWKEEGMTSHDVVFQMRKILKMKKIGHTGTLDPGVAGVLLVCLGQATRLVEFLMDGDKIYQGQICLGQARDTEDRFGQVIEEVRLDQPVPMDQIDQGMARLEGEQIQIPPYYSAVKVKGKRLYEYARAGIEVERPQRQVRIDRFERTSDPVFVADKGLQYWDFYVVCGKGTYVRTLAVDCGQALGYPAHMSKLTRLATGGFNQDQAVTLDQLRQLAADQALDQAIYPIERAVQDFPRIDLTGDQVKSVVHGAVVDQDFFQAPIPSATCLFDQGRLLAIYGPHPSKEAKLKPLKMFPREEA